VNYCRHAEEALRELSEMFGAVLVMGAPQVGKTTLVNGFVGKNARLVTQDDRFQLETFFTDYTPPIFVDEIQRAPGLFPEMKLIMDREKKKGMFFLTASKKFEMGNDITESLAGQLGFLNLSGLSVREMLGVKCRAPFMPTEEYFAERGRGGQALSYDGVWQAIHRGGFPELNANPDLDRELFYDNYVLSYMERYMQSIAKAGDESKFLEFMSTVASFTGQLLNISSMARSAGVSRSTAERWLLVLAASDLFFLLQPYHNDQLKRMVKAPKVYFRDTGLAAYLTRWNTADALKSGAMAGAFFETFVIAEIAKSYTNNGILFLPLYFWRDKDGNEIALLIEDEGTLYPIEVKENADPEKSDVAKFSLLDNLTDTKRGAGGVVCMYDGLVALNGNDRAIPVSYL
jgi:predicted AAA+ superfamily ATPase